MPAYPQPRGNVNVVSDSRIVEMRFDRSTWVGKPPTWRHMGVLCSKVAMRRILRKDPDGSAALLSPAIDAALSTLKTWLTVALRMSHITFFAAFR